MTRTRFPLLETLAIVVVLLAGGSMWLQKSDDRPIVHLHVEWDPPKRDTAVRITWTFNGVTLPPTTKHKSSWDKYFRLNPGDNVLLSGSQYTPGRITSWIAVDGKPVEEPSTRFDIGAVRSRLNRL